MPDRSGTPSPSLQTDMSNDRDLALAALRRSQWLNAETEGLAELLVAEGALRWRQAGDWLHGQGDPEGGVTFIIQGSADLFGHLSDEKSLCLAHAKAGMAWGVASQIGAGVHLTTAICAEPSLVLHVSDLALRRIAWLRPEIWGAVNTLLYRQLSQLVKWILELLALPPRARIATRLLAMMPYNRQAEVFSLSQQDFAEMIGLTRKTVSLHLGRLHDQGVLKLEYGRIHVLDRRALEALV